MKIVIEKYTTVVIMDLEAGWIVNVDIAMGQVLNQLTKVKPARLVKE